MRGEGGSGLDLPAEHDLARRAAPLIGTTAFAELAARADVTSRFLVAVALAWRLGGRDAVDAVTDPWLPPEGALDPGRAALVEAFATHPLLVGDARLAVPSGAAPTADPGPDLDDEWDDDDWDEEWDDDEWDDDEEDRAGPRWRSSSAGWRPVPAPPPRPRPAPVAADPPRVVARRNRVTAGDVQLRLTRSGSWYRFARVADEWDLVAGPAAEPAALFATARRR